MWPIQKIENFFLLFLIDSGSKNVCAKYYSKIRKIAKAIVIYFDKSLSTSIGWKTLNAFFSGRYFLRRAYVFTRNYPDWTDPVVLPDTYSLSVYDWL